MVIFILASLALIAAGYFRVPFLNRQTISEIRKEVQDLKHGLRKMEDEARAASLQPDAYVSSAVNSINILWHEMSRILRNG